MFGGGTDPVIPQEALPLYLTHNGHKLLIDQYQASTLLAQTKGKPFLMFETNTVCPSFIPLASACSLTLATQGSCGGFNGISDSFTSALWGLDYALYMAHSNFTGAMFHLGGQNVFYNVSVSSRYLLLFSLTVLPLSFSLSHVCFPSIWIIIEN
jgi:hypothetical protein